MSILVNKNTRVLTQGITGAPGQLHTRACKEYGTQMVGGVVPGKGGTDFEGIPIYATVANAKKATGATVSVIYVPPPFAAAAIDEAVDAGLDLVICITEGIPVRDMIRTRYRMQGRKTRQPRLAASAIRGAESSSHGSAAYTAMRQWLCSCSARSACRATALFSRVKGTSARTGIAIAAVTAVSTAAADTSATLRSVYLVTSRTSADCVSMMVFPDRLM